MRLLTEFRVSPLFKNFDNQIKREGFVMKFDPWTFVGYLVALALVTLGLLLILWGCLVVLAQIRGLC